MTTFFIVNNWGFSVPGPALNYSPQIWDCQLNVISKKDWVIFQTFGNFYVEHRNYSYINFNDFQDSLNFAC